MGVGAMTGLAGGGLLAQLVADSAAASKQVDTLTRQASSGQVADTYGGLGRLARVSLDLRPQIAQAQAWTTNIDAAGTRLDATQSVLKQLGDIASTFASVGLGVGVQQSQSLGAVAAQAKVALTQVEGLLNTQVGGAYLLSGTDSGTPAMAAGQLDGFAASVAAQVGAMTTGGAAATAAGTLAGAGGWPFMYGAASAAATPPVATTETGAGQTVPLGVVAWQSVPAAPAGSTGSYVRDLLGGLAALAAIDTSAADPATIQDLGTRVATLLQGAGTAITTDAARLGAVQSELTTRKTALGDTTTALTAQVSSVEDADMAATSTALAQVQTQLEASYKLIATQRDLSLTNYL